MNKKLTDTALKRLYFRSSHRGCKETDLVLGAFAEHEMAALTPTQLAVYAAMLDEDDADIWDWLLEKKPTPRADYEPILARLRQMRI